MPFSSDSGKALVDRCVTRLIKCNFFSNKKILDIGPGSGTYSKRYKNQLPDCHWTGVEIWSPYVEKYNLKSHYNSVVESSAQEYLSTEGKDKKFDITFLGDIVEHVDLVTAVQMVADSLKISSLVIISIPIVHYPQGEYDGNPFEAHIKDDWSHNEVMLTLPNIAWYGIENEIGVYFCSLNPELIQDILRPLIGVYAIGKDEMQFAQRMLKSINKADFTAIVDTGSTDGTYEFLSSFRNLNFNVKQAWVDPWRFDDARNIALSLLPSHVDMCVSIDFDEELQFDWYELLVNEIEMDFQKEGRTKDRYYHRFETIWDWKGESKNVSQHWHERIHARKGYMWKLPVHEVLVKSEETAETIKWLGGWKMTQKPDTMKQRGSYKKLLEQSVIEDSTRWKSWSFLAGEYQSGNEFDKALSAYNTAILKKGADIPFIEIQIARLYQSVGNLPEAFKIMSRAAVSSYESRELACYAADLAYLCGYPAQALEWINTAQTRLNKGSGYNFDPSCWDAGFENRKEKIKI